ncbi:MAG: hypothetical protein KUG79_08335 [Pseudomonadales bacterium]|nr:hypothetical protein [Pseudomonadales bacterium]
MNKTLLCCCMVLACIMFTGSCAAKTAIIVHPGNSIGSDRGAISKIFLGKSKIFSDGSKAVSINICDDDPLKSEFEKKVLNKTNAQLKAYWSKFVFTGKGSPPKVTSAAELKLTLATGPTFIGYINTIDLDNSVKNLPTF